MGNPNVNHENHENHEHHHSHKKLYWIIFAALAILTAVELYIPELENVTYVFKATSLTVLAVGKAFLVAYIFMHLNEETRWMKFIAAVPMFALMYAIFVIVESVVR